MMEKTEQAVRPEELFSQEGLLSGSRTGQEVNQQMDQHFANMDQAAAQYWQSCREAAHE